MERSAKALEGLSVLYFPFRVVSIYVAPAAPLQSCNTTLLRGFTAKISIWWKNTMKIWRVFGMCFALSGVLFADESLYAQHLDDLWQVYQQTLRKAKYRAIWHDGLER